MATTLNFRREKVKAKNRSTDISSNWEQRESRGSSLLSFGVRFLDDAFLGIAKEDLILVGAYSGGGKTELVTNIALENIKKGKKVYFFALEAEPLEIENRILYRLMTQNYYQDPDREKHLNLDYANWYYGKLPSLGTYDLKAQYVFKTEYRTLFTYYKDRSFDLKEFVKEFTDVSIAGADLIIIDHAHYFDWGDKNENDGLKQVVTAARDLNLLHEVPVILVSHLRKRDYKTNLYAPTQEDFHGSSELYKRATKAITLGAGEYNGDGTIDTYINPVKFRSRGEVTRVTARVRYNFKYNAYEQDYEIGRSQQQRDKEFEIFEKSDLPRWCKRPK